MSQPDTEIYETFAFFSLKARKYERLKMFYKNIKRSHITERDRELEGGIQRDGGVGGRGNVSNILPHPAKSVRLDGFCQLGALSDTGAPPEHIS